jgi:hypothetical protein
MSIKVGSALEVRPFKLVEAGTRNEKEKRPAEAGQDQITVLLLLTYLRLPLFGLPLCGRAAG